MSIFMSKRIEWIDVVKGILILTVIIGHAIQEQFKVRGLYFEDNIWRNIIYSFHMPAFMAMSGYLAYRPKPTELRMSIISKKFYQLMVPFFIWTVPLFFMCNNVDNIFDYVLYPNKGYWFLWALFFIIVIYNVVDWACLKSGAKQEIGIAITIVLLIFGQIISPNSKLLGYEYIAYYFIFYMMGYYANKYQMLFPRNKWIAIALFLIWAIMACFWTPNDLPFFLENIPLIPHKVLQLGYRMLTPVIFILGMYSFAPHMKVGISWIWKIIIELGQTSLGLYLAHMLFKSILADIMFDWFPQLPIWIGVVVEFLLLTVLSIGLVRVIKKNKVASKLLLGIYNKR